MSAISNFLSFLRSAIYAIDVRDGIADAIEQCYNDVNNPTLKTEALEAALQNKIDEGEMAALTIGDHTITAAKLAQGVIDNTLATSGAAADAKKTGDELTAIKADLGDKVEMSETIILPSNYATLLPDLDSLDLIGKAYTFVTTKAVTAKNGGLWNKVPFELEKRQCIGVIYTFGNATSKSGTTQIMYIANLGLTYTRYLNRVGSNYVWMEWRRHNQEIIVASDGSGDFTSLTEGINYATQFTGCTVTVKNGTYDIIQEYKTLYGSSFFDNYSASTEDVGIVLKNNVTVKFSPKAKVVCRYTGNNTNVQHRFSPFNSGNAGFTLINADVESVNVRYSVHDERQSDTDIYHNRYINCRFVHDKSTGSGYMQPLGGGLGVNGLIDIDGCYFKSIGYSGRNILTWHNCIESGAKSEIHIKNSIVDGQIKFTYYGTSTEISTMYINGCKMSGEPVMAETSQEYDTVNVEIVSWGNTIVN